MPITITNTTKGALGLSPDERHLVPAGGSIQMKNADLTALKSSPVVKAWLADGSLVESGAADAPAEIDAERGVAILSAAEALTEDDMTAKGQPDLRALNAALPEGMEKVTADERDTLFPAVE